MARIYEINVKNRYTFEDGIWYIAENLKTRRPQK
jgi:hypothetical protein